MQSTVLQEEEEGIPDKRPEYMVDEDIDGPSEDDEEYEQVNGVFDSCCSFCDNGGDILCCEGKCMRSFHASKQTGDSEAEICEGLGLSEAQIKNMAHFFCENCKQQLHQCFICGQLGSSDVTSNGEVFPCINGNCGKFYHPKCVSKALQQQSNDNQIKDLEKRIAEEKSLVCPAHRCFSCKKVEDITAHEKQFAVCRRCPKSYHRKCLPREIMFDTGDEMDILPRAWDGLLPKRILIYCLDHEIVPSLGTPLRNHITFPNVCKVKLPNPEKTEKPFSGLKVMEKKQKRDETALGNTLKQVASEPSRLVDKPFYALTFGSQKKTYSSKLNQETTSHVKDLPKPFTSSSVLRDDPPPIRNNKLISENKRSTNLYSEKLNPHQSAKPLPSPAFDTESERRVTALTEKVDSSFGAEEFLKKRKITSMYDKTSKDVIDKNLTQGKVDGMIKTHSIEDMTCDSMDFMGLHLNDQHEVEGLEEVMKQTRGKKVGVIDGAHNSNRGKHEYDCFHKMPEFRHVHDCDETVKLSGHGFQCASVLAGKPQEANFFGINDGAIRGVVPHAQLYVYTVGCESCRRKLKGFGKAFDLAMKDEVKVISMSMGESPGSIIDYKYDWAFKEDVIAQKTLEAYEKNILTCLPVGNDGPTSESLTYGMPWCVNVGACAIGKTLVTKVHIGTKGTVPCGTNILWTCRDENDDVIKVLDTLEGVSKNIQESKFLLLRMSTKLVDDREGVLSVKNDTTIDLLQAKQGQRDRFCRSTSNRVPTACLSSGSCKRLKELFNKVVY